MLAPCYGEDDSESDSMADVTAAPDGAAASKTNDDELSADKNKKLPPALIGMSAGLKHLYAGKEDKRGRFRWQTTIPDDLGEPAENAETAKWALIVRHVKVYNDPSRVLAMHSILIQSPLLKEFLKGILKGYPGITVGLNQLELGGMFEPLLHRWSELHAALETLEKEGDFSPLSEDDIKKRQADITAMLDTTDEHNEHQSADGHDSDSNNKKDTSDDKLETGDQPDQSVDHDDTTKLASGGLTPHNTSPDQESTDDAVEAMSDGANNGASTTVKTKELGSYVDKFLQPGESLADSKDTIKLRHAKLLVELLTKEFLTLIESSLDMRSKGVMTYEHVWSLFQPGALVYCRQEGQDRVFKLVTSRYGKDRQGNPCYMLTLRYVDFDGNRFGTSKIATRIFAFPGTKSIVSLSAFPLEYHHNKVQLRAKLIERGAKVEDLSGTRYVAYDGLGWRYNDTSKAFTTIKGRVVVDTLGWNKEGGDHISVAPFKVKHDDDTDESSRRIDSWSCCGLPDCYSDMDDYSDLDDDYGIPMDGNAKAAADQLQAAPLDDEQRLICTHLLRGYALKEKMWLNIYANSVQEIQFNTRAFDALVLPSLQKELILGFTATQQLWRNSFDDVISGKGRGIIMLLSGPPGVGKTLTAESVAEEMKVPLYLLSAGELGHDNAMVEARLSTVFDMVTRWNAVLLLDESEIFLEERSLENLERNKLVCTFLRVLEYYEGIMFMTTNRVKTIDSAFQSRIHISLDYQELTMESRKQIWTNFLGQYNKTQEALRDKGPTGGLPPSRTTVVAWKPKPHVPATAKSNGQLGREQSDTDTSSHGNHGSSTESALPIRNHINPLDPNAQETKPPSEDEIEAHKLRTRSHTMTKADIDDLARLRLNGRHQKHPQELATACQPSAGTSYKEAYHYRARGHAASA